MKWCNASSALVVARRRCFWISDPVRKHDLYETLEYLADKAGITLGELRSRDDEERQQLLQIPRYHSSTITIFWLNMSLAKPPELISQFGKPPVSRSSCFKLVTPFLSGMVWLRICTERKISTDLLMKAGLVIKGRGGRYYDRSMTEWCFHPELSRSSGGFFCRIMPSSSDETAKQEAKYINSPETLLYHKSKMLFGYSELHQSIREKRKLWWWKGSLMWLLLPSPREQCGGSDHGSALTNDHALLLNRTVERVLLAIQTQQE